MAENESEGKWKDVMDKLSSIEDLQNVTQLDIINLKNDIEGIKLSTSTPIPPEIEEKMVEMENLARHSDVIKEWKKTVDEVKFLRSKVMGEKGKPSEKGKEEPAPKPAKDFSSDIESLRKEIEDVRKELKAKGASPAPPAPGSRPPEGFENEIGELRRQIEEMRGELKSQKSPAPQPQIDLSSLREAIDENRKTIENLKSQIPPKPPSDASKLAPVKRMIKENKKIIEELKAKVEKVPEDVPDDTRKEIDSLHKEISKLETEVKNLRGDEDEEEIKGEVDSLRKELFTKLEDLNAKVGATPEELEEAINANRLSVQRIKSLVVGEDREVDDIRSEVDENKKMLRELKKTVLSKKPAGTGKKKQDAKPDPALKKKMSRIEKRVESLGKKLDRVTKLKPIDLPKMEAPEAAGRVDVTKMRKDIDNVLSKLNGFLTKEDVEKGMLDKKLKTDEKMIREDLYNELNEIKKAIVRNEDHINSVVSDMEEVKKEVGTVEKREWGNVNQLPDIESLKKRIADLENQLEKLQGESIVIE